MSREANLEIVRQRFGEHPILDEADADLGAIYSTDVVLHGPGERFVGLEGIKEAAEATRSAFSDIAFQVGEMTAEEEDKVVTKIMGRSRHTGLFQGAQPTGKWVQIDGIVITRLQDGKIVEEWRNMTWSPADPPGDAD